MVGIRASDVVNERAGDAATLNIDENDGVTLTSPYGSLGVTARLSEQVQPGTIWLPESLPDAPTGALLNGLGTTAVRVESQSD